MSPHGDEFATGPSLERHLAKEHQAHVIGMYETLNKIHDLLHQYPDEPTSYYTALGQDGLERTGYVVEAGTNFARPGTIEPSHPHTGGEKE